MVVEVVVGDSEQGRGRRALIRSFHLVGGFYGFRRATELVDCKQHMGPMAIICESLQIAPPTNRITYLWCPFSLKKMCQRS